MLDRLRHAPRLPGRVFFGLTGVGLVASIVLTFLAAVNRPALVVSKAIVHRTGLVASVQVTVRNRAQSTAYCPIVSIAAVDRDSLDIERLTASPVENNAMVSPGATVGYKAVFTHLTRKDYKERLSEFRGFVKEQRPCGGH